MPRNEKDLRDLGTKTRWSTADNKDMTVMPSKSWSRCIYFTVENQVSDSEYNH